MRRMAIWMGSVLLAASVLFGINSVLNGGPGPQAECQRAGPWMRDQLLYEYEVSRGAGSDRAAVHFEMLNRLLMMCPLIENEATMAAQEAALAERWRARFGESWIGEDD